MGRNNFGNDFKQKIELIMNQFNIFPNDLRKILKLPDVTGPITLTEVANIGCYSYCRLCDCLYMNYDFFINASSQELKEELKLKDIHVVTKNFQEVVEGYQEDDEAIKKVLVVDDELSFLFVLRMMLRKNNYVVIEAINGKEACDILRTEKVDLIISDIKMPIMDGLEFLHEFQKMNIEVPIIIMSASPNIEREEIIAQGASDFLQKPLVTETLINCVKKYLG